MKNNLIKRILALLLALMALPLMGCDPKGAGGSEETTAALTEGTGQTEASSLSVIAGGVSSYVIVVPQKDADALTVAYALRTAILKSTGVKLTVVKDNAEPAEWEILIGNTNRPDGAALNGEVIMPEDYRVGVVGKSLVVAGKSEAALQSAVDRLLLECCINGSFTVASTYTLSFTREYFQLVKNGASDYVFVVEKGSEENYNLAYYLQNHIRNTTGVRVKIVFDDAEAQSHEILIGDPDRPEIAQVRKAFTSDFDFYVGVIEEKLVVCGSTQGALKKAVEWFADNLHPTEEGFNVAADLSHHSNEVNFEILASLINNKTNESGYQALATLEKSTVYFPTESWWYSHHAAFSIINGVMVAVWSQGRFNEDDVGQRIAYSTSTDFQHWTPSKPLVDTWQGQYSEMVLGCAGLYNDGKQLIVYFNAGEYEPEKLRENGTLRPVEDGVGIGHGRWYVSTIDGIHWTEPQKLSVGGGGHQGPQPMGNGELLWAGGYRHAYTDDPTGITWDGNASVDLEYAKSIGAEMLVEGSFFVKDGVVYMFHRTGTDRLYVAFSTDWGRTWTDPYKTNFTDANTKFMFGQLPDGRYYCVSDPDPAGRGQRTPMILQISEDGLNWNEQYMLGNSPHTQKMDGMYKGGIYAYPNCFISEDGYFYAIYSLHKEDIEILRFKLTEIAK